MTKSWKQRGLAIIPFAVGLPIAAGIGLYVYVGHDGESLGGMMASLMTFPEYGLVVSVTSNTSYADTFSMAVKIAGIFAQQAKRTT